MKELKKALEAHQSNPTKAQEARVKELASKELYALMEKYSDVLIRLKNRK